MLIAVAAPDTRKHSTMQWCSSLASTFTHSSSSSSSSGSSTSSSCCSSGSARSVATLDEALDLEALALSAGSDYEDTCRSSRWRQSHCDGAYGKSGGSGYSNSTAAGSGLPLVCSNCGVSFFSLQITDDELECYCSGECKWSVVMYREMDRRMHALRRHVRAARASAATATAATAAARRIPSASSYVSSARSSATTVATTASSRSNNGSERYSCHYLDGVIPCR